MGDERTERRLERLEAAVAGIGRRIRGWLEMRDRIGRPPSVEGAMDLLNEIAGVVERNMVEDEEG